MELPNLNTGQPWSAMDLADLENCLERGDSVEEIAELMCRKPSEVREKIAELDDKRT